MQTLSMSSSAGVMRSLSNDAYRPSSRVIDRYFLGYPEMTAFDIAGVGPRGAKRRFPCASRSCLPRAQCCAGVILVLLTSVRVVAKLFVAERTGRGAAFQLYPSALGLTLRCLWNALLSFKWWTSLHYRLPFCACTRSQRQKLVQ